MYSRVVILDTICFKRHQQNATKFLDFDINQGSLDFCYSSIANFLQFKTSLDRGDIHEDEKQWT